MNFLCASAFTVGTYTKGLRYDSRSCLREPLFQRFPSSLKLSTESTRDGAETSNTFQSTLRLLEHVNLNVPNHDHIVPFYFCTLGMCPDPRRAANIIQKSGTVWANCGASQFHLPFGEDPQTIPGSIGLVYNDLSQLKARLLSNSANMSGMNLSWSLGNDLSGEEYIKISDNYGNTFYCRCNREESEHENEHNLFLQAKQPLVYNSNECIDKFGTVAETYGVPNGQGTECLGIKYVEFLVPPNTAARIAEFYECVFDAPTFEEGGIAIIGIGAISRLTGRASQNIIFREAESKDEIPPYDGHHIALYVGNDQPDFEQAFKNCDDAGVVWVNPRFSDKATNLNTAKKYKQFRFKNIVDLKSGRTIFELEHEVRSVTHDAWPGP